MIKQINKAIGANGIVAEECKKAVKIFGNRIFDMLTSSVQIEEPPILVTKFK